MKDIKKYLIGGIIGLIIGSIGVYAGTLMNSNEVTFTPNNNKWNVTKVDEALNSLYSVAVPEEYSGTTLVTPTYSDITLNTQDKLLKNNITISGIPSTYKNLTNTTTVTAGDLATGKTAYNNVGELITGTATLGGDCVYGEFDPTKVCPSSGGCTIFEGFNPSVFMVKMADNNKTYLQYYNASDDSDHMYQFHSDKSTWSVLAKTTYFKIENNKLIYPNLTNSSMNKLVKYVVCK